MDEITANDTNYTALFMLVLFTVFPVFIAPSPISPPHFWKKIREKLHFDLIQRGFVEKLSNVP